MASEPEVQQLKEALLGAGVVLTTGLVLQDLLPQFSGARASARIVERFAALPLIPPERGDACCAPQAYAADPVASVPAALPQAWQKRANALLRAPQPHLL